MLHPDNGLEVSLWDDEVLFCRRQNGRAMATRYIPYKRAADIVAVLRCYKAMTTVSCSSTAHTLTVHFNRLFVFRSTLSGERQSSSLLPDDVSKVADAIEARLSAPVTGVALSPEVLQAKFDEAYPREAALRRRKDEKFIAALEKTRRLEIRRPTVWQSFRDLVLADIRSGKPCASLIFYQLRATAPDYAADIFASRFVEQFPEHAQYVGWAHLRRLPSLALPPEPKTHSTSLG